MDSCSVSTFFLLLDATGDGAASSRGSACTTDYVIIPDGVDNEGTVDDRYCGLGFPASVQCESL